MDEKIGVRQLHKSNPVLFSKVFPSLGTIAFSLEPASSVGLHNPKPHETNKGKMTDYCLSDVGYLHKAKLFVHNKGRTTLRVNGIALEQ